MAVDVGDPTHREDEDEKPQAPATQPVSFIGTDPVSGGQYGTAYTASSGSLTPAQIAKIAYNAGFRGKSLQIAVAVALAESRGNPGAHNPNGEDSRGLWQINVDPSTSWGRARAQKYGDLFDPAKNARAAFEISGGGKNFGPWTTYSGASAAGKNNSYTRFMDEAGSGVQQLAAAGYDVPVPDVGEGQVVAASADGVTPAPAPESMNAAGLSVPVVSDAVANLGDEELRDYLEQNYGYLAWALRIPEVGDILLDVARGDVTDPDKLFGQLYETDWWQNTSASVRQWDAFANQDPTTAKEQVRAAQQSLKAYAARLGLVVDEERLWHMGRDALRFGWVQPGQDVASSMQARNALFAEANKATVRPEQAAAGDAAALEQGYDATYARVKQAFQTRGVEIATVDETEEERLDRITRTLMDGSRTWDSVRTSLDMQRPREPGLLTATADTLKAMASDFLVPLSDHTARSWSERIARGETTQEAFRSYLQQQSTSLFSGNASIARALESGMTVRDWADPYVQMASQMLEVAPTEIDLNDQKWMRALHQVDPKAGGGTPMGLGDFQRYVRGLPEWDRTQGAVEKASAAVEFLGQRMGAI